MNETKYISIKNKIQQLLALFGLCFIVFSIFWFFSSKNEAERMEKTIQHAINVKPLVYEKIIDEYPLIVLEKNELVFNFYSSTTTLIREKSGHEKRTGIYSYTKKDNSIKVIISWEENDVFFINSIKVQ